MELVALLVGVAVSGLVFGVLARLAVPGPDPMPLWRTILLGAAGSLLGGVLATVLGPGGPDGGGDVGMSFLFSLIGATLLLIAYRRFFQGRGITGPGARRRPGAHR